MVRSFVVACVPGLVLVALSGCGSGSGAPDPVPDAPAGDTTLVATDLVEPDLPAPDDAVASDPIDPGTAVETGGEDASDEDTAGPVDPVASFPLPTLVFGPCDFSDWSLGGNPKPSASAGVECATAEVPLDWLQPDGARLTLRIARQKAKNHPTGRVLFSLMGGPGGSAVEMSGIMPALMPWLKDDFDFVYVDQRGTGESDRLDCAMFPDGSSLGWAKCGEALAAAGREPDHYRSLDAARDLELVRAALGYETIRFYGVSYGTRLALEYIRQYGARVASAALDGNIPPDTDFYSDLLRTTEIGVDLLVTDCAADPACVAVTADLRADLEARRAALALAPHSILVGGEAFDEDVGAFMDLLTAAMSDARYRFSIPRAVHASVAGDNGPWNQLLSRLIGSAVVDAPVATPAAPGVLPRLPRLRLTPPGSPIAEGHYRTIMCSEFRPNAPSLADLQALGASLAWGAELAADALVAVKGCDDGWPVEPLPPALRQPVESGAKVLLVNGALDLNTKAGWGAHAAATLPNATNLIVPHATHATLTIPCVAGILSGYLSGDGDPAKFNTACLDTLTHPDW